MQKIIDNILKLSPPYNLKKYEKIIGESFPDDFLYDLENFIKDSLNEDNLKANIDALEGLKTILNYKNEFLVKTLNDYINAYIDQEVPISVDEFKTRIASFVETFSCILPLSDENSKIMESLVFLGWHEKYEEFKFCHKEMKLHYTQPDKKLAVAYFGGTIKPEIFDVLMDCGFNFLKENQFIALDSHNNSQKYLTQKHFVNFVGEDESGRLPMHDVETIKSSSFFQQENWKEWDINTLEHPAFQKRVMYLNPDLEGLAEQKEVYHRSFSYLEYVKNLYENELDSLMIRLNHNEHHLVTLKEYLEKSLHEKLKNEFCIKENLQKDPVKFNKTGRF